MLTRKSITWLPFFILASFLLVTPQPDVLVGQTVSEDTVSRESGQKHLQTLEADPELQAFLEANSFQSTVPGVIVGIAEEDQPLRLAAVGKRKIDDDATLQLSDPMHLGSCTKAMTSLLVGRLIDQEKLSLEDTIADRLPELAQRIDPSYHEVTLHQCLTHRTGMDANAKNWWLNAADDSLSIQEKRFLVAVDSLSEASQHPPGTNYLYSNLGYLIAGLMIEKVTEGSWEDAMTDHLFQPLGITNYGFGIPGTKGKVDAPWGHRLNEGKNGGAIQGDNAPALGPAGTVFMPMAEWSKLVLTVNQGYRLSRDAEAEDCGAAKMLLAPATWKQLLEVTSVDNKPTNYACGWSVLSRPWAGGVTLTHSGSNTMWFAVVWTAPTTKKAYLVAVNAAGDDTGTVVDQIVSKVIQLDLKGSASKN